MLSFRIYFNDSYIFFPFMQLISGCRTRTESCTTHFFALPLFQPLAASVVYLRSKVQVYVHFYNGFYHLFTIIVTQCTFYFTVNIIVLILHTLALIYIHTYLPTNGVFHRGCRFTTTALRYFNIIVKTMLTEFGIFC